MILAITRPSLVFTTEIGSAGIATVEDLAPAMVQQFVTNIILGGQNILTTGTGQFPVHVSVGVNDSQALKAVLEGLGVGSSDLKKLEALLVDDAGTATLGDKTKK
jgi:hypothetical protein